MRSKNMMAEVIAIDVRDYGGWREESGKLDDPRVLEGLEVL